MTAGEFLATQNSLFVHWEKLSDLTKPDREMLAAIGHPKTRGLPAPDIRSLRHGYHPWYVTEQEARALTLCLRAFLYAGKRLRETDPADPALWSRVKVYPLISVDESGIPQAMKPENPPDPKPELGPPPVLDQARIDLILARKLPPSGVFQIDHFYGTGKVGERNERPGCVRMILVIDGESGMIYSPQILPPEAVLGDSLVETLLGAIESANMLPKEVHVRREEYRIPLLALADLLKIRVLIKDRLPNLDMAKDALLGMMGDPGTIAMEQPAHSHHVPGLTSKDAVYSMKERFAKIASDWLTEQSVPDPCYLSSSPANCDRP